LLKKQTPRGWNVAAEFAGVADLANCAPELIVQVTKPERPCDHLTRSTKEGTFPIWIEVEMRRPLGLDRIDRLRKVAAWQDQTGAQLKGDRQGGAPNGAGRVRKTSTPEIPADGSVGAVLGIPKLHMSS
jgi:hypothetical protein